MQNKIAYITRIKDEEQLMYNNLKYYYNMGIRNFYITFNNSNKETENIVNRFNDVHPESKLFIFFESNTEYNQIEQFNFMSTEAFKNGHTWHVPVDADELLVLKNETLQELIKRHDVAEYGYINFRWVDYIPTKKHKNYFLSCEYRYPKGRPQSKIIVKWCDGMRYGHGHHLVVSKRKLLEEYTIKKGFMAHYANRNKEQIKKKRIRIGEAFIEKYGYDMKSTNMGQVEEYKQWKKEGDVYFDRVWHNICEQRKKLDNFVYDPLDENMFI